MYFVKFIVCIHWAYYTDLWWNQLGHGYSTITTLVKSWIQFARNLLRILILVFTAIWNWYIAFISLSFSGFECRVILTLQSVFRVCLLLLLCEAVWGMLVINSLKVWKKWYLGWPWAFFFLRKYLVLLHYHSILFHFLLLWWNTDQKQLGEDRVIPSYSS